MKVGKSLDCTAGRIKESVAKVGKQPLFSLTSKDFEWSYTKGTGAGGQKRNKTSSAVHCRHDASGAVGYSEASRSQADNKREAWEKCVRSERFQQWIKLEMMRRVGKLADVEAWVDREMRTNVRIEGKDDQGRWVPLG